MFREYGYAFLSATDETRELVWDMMQVRALSATAKQEQIAGQWCNSTSRGSSCFTADRQQQLQQVVHSSMRCLGLDSGGRMHLVDPKLLSGASGMGEQEIHWDSATLEECEGKISILLYCSPGALSTAMPRFRLRDFPTANQEDMQRSAHYSNT